MKLESLPNEILLDLFGYFNGTDLLRAFHGLNSRFNLLLYKQIRFYYFKFNCISKRDFDIICQQHLPSFAAQIIAVQLSDYIDTPEQINFFLSYIPSFKPFIHLQSLTICFLQSYQLLVKLLDECQHLPNLTYLCFSSCFFGEPDADGQWIVDKIWSLPKLTHCYIHINIRNERTFFSPTIKSTILQSVGMFFNDLQWNEINQLIEYTPNLQYLSAFMAFLFDEDYEKCILPTLTKCKLYSYDLLNVSNIDVTFPTMPNLHQLYIDIYDRLIDGRQWESIIQNYLPQLKIFRLRMEVTCYSRQNHEQEVDELFESFRTSFWIDEHHWFVRCLTAKGRIYLYTPPDVFNDCHNIFPESWRSTCSDDNEEVIYNHITNISDETLFDKLIASNIRLSNIAYLRIKLPINDQFWSVISNFNQLKTLLIYSYVDTFSSQLQRLLDRAPFLKKLSICQNELLPLQSSLFKHTNASVRELDLSEYNYYLNEDECLQLTRSSLVIQCEVLSIRVTCGKSIISLVENISSLRSLTVQCSDNGHQPELLLKRQKVDLISWLKERLPSTYAITRELKDDKNILIWI